MMLRILGSAALHAADYKLRRRDLLRAGVLGTAALTSAVVPGRAATDEVVSPLPHFGRAKRVLLLYLYGAAAQHETFDPKPQAPAEIRGDFQPIPTTVPGLNLCEHLPKLAQVMDRVTVIRSMTHPYNIHSAAYTTTGVDKVDVAMELNPYDNRHWPFFGSVIDYLETQSRPRSAPPEVPRNMGLPFQFSSHAPEFQRGGPYGGFLGQAWNPVWTEFEGDATRPVNRWRGERDQLTPDPFNGISPAGKLNLSRTAQLRPELTLDRLSRRRGLLEQLDAGQRLLDHGAATASSNRFQEMAYSLLTSRRLRDALDLQQEPMALREQYGMTLFGQSVLAARRLLEAGAQVATVFWDEYGPANTAWDTHFDHYERLKTELLPGLDSALSAVLRDLESRGMLDDTLVLCLTEHGRTPRLSLQSRGVGREHWSETYCNIMAGAGISQGRVIGSSDDQGAFVKDHPVSPKDILNTIYHLMGHSPRQLIRDRLGRPLPLVSGGEVLEAALA